MTSFEKNELISVIMGVKYTRADTGLLERAVGSILRQTHTELELIICERDSVNKAKDYLRRISAEDGRVKLIDGSAAGSLSAQLNLCLTGARGDWIARMDDDDFSHPDRFEKQLRFLKEHKDVAFVGSCVEFEQDGAHIGRGVFPPFPQPKDFLFSQPFIHPAVMFRAEALKAVSGYSELSRCRRCEDFDLFMRLYNNGFRGANMQDILFDYTLPPHGVTTRNFKDRTNEMKTRFACFKECGMLPKALPYVVKPILVWLIPPKVLAELKRKRNIKNG